MRRGLLVVPPDLHPKGLQSETLLLHLLPPEALVGLGGLVGLLLLHLGRLLLLLEGHSRRHHREDRLRPEEGRLLPLVGRGRRPLREDRFLLMGSRLLPMERSRRDLLEAEGLRPLR